MWQDVVQAREHFVHQIEIDLAQAEGVDAAELGLARVTKPGSSAAAAEAARSAIEGCARVRPLPR